MDTVGSDSGDPSALLRLVEVEVSVTDPRPTRILGPVSMAVHQNESVAVVGRSGSGKTTLITVAGLLRRPTSGTVTISGTASSALSDGDLARARGDRLGFVFQSANMIDRRTALQNLMCAAPRLSRRERARRAREVLDRVGLGDAVDRPTSVLSGGERQRVAVARALLAEPDVLIADEPTGNLDTANARKVLDLLFEVGRDGRGLLLVTHDVDAARLADRVLTLEDGRLR